MMKKIITTIFIFSALVLTFSCGKKETTIGEKTFDVSKNYTICINSSVEGSEFDSMRKGFVMGLRDLGLVEDINVTYHYANAEGNESYASQIADAFKEKNPNLFVTIGNTSTKATSEKYNDIPIVFLGVANAERLGYCDANGKPTSNMTGVADSHLFEEHLDFIIKNYTDVKRIGIIYTKDSELAQFDIDYLKFFSTGLGIDIYTVSITKAEDIEKALDNIMPKVDAITLLQDYIVDDNLNVVMDRAKKENKVVFGSTSTHKNAGAEVAIIRDYALVGEEGAKLAKEILVDGKKASELTVKQVNFKVN